MTDMLTFQIDLNMLRGDRTTSHVDFMLGAIGRSRSPHAGETVWAIDEDDARYLAVVENVAEGGFIELRLKLETKTRAHGELNPVSPNPMIVPPQWQTYTHTPAATANPMSDH